jgi:hypothetical protein
MIEAIIIAGVILASAILIYVGIHGLRESEEVELRRMARTLVRSVEQRAEWDITLNSRGDKWARIVLVLQDMFDVEDDWLHIIIGEAQFDMEADNGSNTKDRTRDPGPDLRRVLAGDSGSSGVGGGDGEQHRVDSWDDTDWAGLESTGGTDHEDFGEDPPIPSAG